MHWLLGRSTLSTESKFFLYKAVPKLCMHSLLSYAQYSYYFTLLELITPKTFRGVDIMFNFLIFLSLPLWSKDAGFVERKNYDMTSRNPPRRKRGLRTIHWETLLQILLTNFLFRMSTATEHCNPSLLWLQQTCSFP
jgi:hypothetical protein